MTVQVLTEDSFDAEVMQADEPVLVDFWAPGCGPCKLVVPILDSLAEDYEGRAKIAKMDIGQSPSIWERFEIRGVPTVLVFHKGEVKTTLVGAQPTHKYAHALDDAIEGEVKDREEPVFTAEFIHSSDIDTFKTVLAERPEYADQRIDGGYKPLSHALKSGNQEKIDAILACDPELDIHQLVMLGRTSEVALLLDEKPELVDAKDVMDATPLLVAIGTGHCALVELLLDRGAAWEPWALLHPALATSVDVLRLLMSRGLELGHAVPGVYGTLHLAAMAGSPEVIEFLLEQGLDPTVRDGGGKTPLEVAQQGANYAPDRQAVIDVLKSRMPEQ